MCIIGNKCKGSIIYIPSENEFYGDSDSNGSLKVSSRDGSVKEDGDWDVPYHYSSDTELWYNDFEDYAYMSSGDEEEVELEDLCTAEHNPL